MKTKLTNPTDDELNEAFAWRVAGWREGELGDCRVWFDKTNAYVCDISDAPNFTRSMDAVLPYLEKLPIWDITWDGKRATCGVSLDAYTFYYEATAETPAKATVIALLRAHGVEVEFTP